jgi:spore germination cell wall hydrolase CwlJ-like protein
MRWAALMAAMLAAGCMIAEGGTARNGPDVAFIAMLPSGGGKAAAEGPPVEDIMTAGKIMPVAEPSAPLDDPLTCLARTVYWEAKGEGVRGMNAVAHVVLNRVSSQKYPDDVCGVIKDGGRAAPCQFSWYCDTRSNVAQEEDAYEVAHRIAWQALSGSSADPTAGATMFHNPTVNPSWTRVAEKTAVIGNHTFYVLD